MRALLRIPISGWAVVALASAWAAVHVVAANTITDSVFDGGLLGTDSYMRLVRVDELAKGGGWFDSTIARSNAPFGDELHWTRPFDILLLSVTLPLTPFLGFDDALFVAGATLSPLIHLVMTGALVWAAIPIVGRSRAPMAAIVMLVQPAILGHTVAGQADHHSLQLLLLVLEIGLLVRLLVESGRPRGALAAGAVAGLGIWVSTEMTILAGLTAVALVVAWIADPLERLGTLARFGTGLAAVLTLAIVTERLPSEWLAVEYDKVSVAHVAAGVAVLLTAGGLHAGRPRGGTTRGRIWLASIVGGVTAAALLGSFGGLIAGLGPSVNPALGPIWLDHVSELQPLVPTDGESMGKFVLFLGASVVCLPVAALAVRDAAPDRRAVLVWGSIFVLLATYSVLSLVHLRFSSFTGVLVAIVSAQLLGMLRDRIGRVPRSVWRRVTWAGATLALSVGFTVSGGMVAAATTARPADVPLGCPRSAYHAVADLGGVDGAVTFANLNLGPEMLYRSSLSVVAGPYHRNDEGIVDLHSFFSGTDFGVSRARAAERGGRLVLLCGLDLDTELYASSSDLPSLHDRLISDAPPGWLRIVASGQGDEYFRLYEIEERS